jgi:hypothetical protein
VNSSRGYLPEQPRSIWLRWAIRPAAHATLSARRKLHHQSIEAVVTYLGGDRLQKLSGSAASHHTQELGAAAASRLVDSV